MSALKLGIPNVFYVAHLNKPLAVTVWPDLAKFRHFGTRLQVFGNCLTVYFLFGEMLSLFWQICDIIGLIFFVANG